MTQPTQHTQTEARRSAMLRTAFCPVAGAGDELWLRAVASLRVERNVTLSKGKLYEQAYS